MSEIYSPDQSQGNRASSSSYPESAEELLRQALAFHSGNRLAEAADLYREVLEMEPDHLQACFNLGTIFHAGGELPRAISYYREVRSRAPENFQVLYYLANALRDEGSREEAVVTYQQAIRANPAYADAHYNLGIIHYQQGESEQAVACYLEAVSIDPAHADSLYNIGIIHFERHEYAAAAASYEKALLVRPGDVDTLFNLAFTCASLGHLEKAALHYHEAIELAPEDAELHNSLGSILRKLNKPELAAACYRQAVSLRPDYGSAWTNLATIQQMLGQDDEALACYSKAIEFGDHTESADFMMAALTGSNRQTPPRSYVRDLYDGFAESFEQSLVANLEYKAPQLLRKLCSFLVGEDRRFRRAADLGCGTGLVGEQFREMVDHLSGVDLSEKMLAKAGEREIYDRLCCGDISDFLEGGTVAEFDLVIAADVLIYIGELESFFRSVRRQISLDGYLFFSTERLDAPGDYRLLKTGRYAHSESYIRLLAGTYGFRVEACREVLLRKEKGKWLPGYVFALCPTC